MGASRHFDNREEGTFLTRRFVMMNLGQVRCMLVVVLLI